ncbi:TetR/AcrR family transcriptional regulator [Aeromicrobium phragmitis]|uniref:TetR/AcrR family transcriptional regulator n=2 Tax=Aeromicrobium phragmitis TaxID=2478914 RepID=A0A3L8PN68_9ACTN|nr:TetR/AcrR family transcriptional regulator [Aeromicrobium phragmitis]
MLGAKRDAPGRPRTEGHDERILEAVLGLIDRDEPVTVNAVVEASGVSRAALYRRWPRMTDLIAAALDRGRANITLDLSGDVKEAIVAVMFGDLAAVRGVGYSERRFRTRLALVMANPELQRAYWTSHVRRRREAMVEALRTAVDRGMLRDDLDLESCIDAINGVFYYQSVVRGCSFDDPEAIRRCREAFEVIWRGMERGHPAR